MSPPSPHSLKLLHSFFAAATTIVFLLAAVAIPRSAVVGQVVVPPGSQFSTTKFTAIDCNPTNNTFNVQFFAGINSGLDPSYTVTCTCDTTSLVANPPSLAVAAGNTGTFVCSGADVSTNNQFSIYGQACTFKLFVTAAQQNGAGGSQTFQLDTTVATCGPLDSPCDAGFWDLPSQITDCDPADFSMFWFVVIWLPVAAVIYLIVGCVYAGESISRHNKYSRHAHMSDTLNKERNPHPQKMAALYLAALENGSITRDSLIARQNALEQFVNSPEAASAIAEAQQKSIIAQAEKQRDIDNSSWFRRTFSGARYSGGRYEKVAAGYGSGVEDMELSSDPASSKEMLPPPIPVAVLNKSLARYKNTMNMIKAGDRASIDKMARLGKNQKMSGGKSSNVKISGSGGFVKGSEYYNGSSSGASKSGAAAGMTHRLKPTVYMPEDD